MIAPIPSVVSCSREQRSRIQGHDILVSRHRTGSEIVVRADGVEHDGAKVDQNLRVRILDADRFGKNLCRESLGDFDDCFDIALGHDSVDQPFGIGLECPRRSRTTLGESARMITLRVFV